MSIIELSRQFKLLQKKVDKLEKKIIRDNEMRKVWNTWDCTEDKL